MIIDRAVYEKQCLGIRVAKLALFT